MPRRAPAVTVALTAVLDGEPMRPGGLIETAWGPGDHDAYEALNLCRWAHATH